MVMEEPWRVLFESLTAPSGQEFVVPERSGGENRLALGLFLDLLELIDVGENARELMSQRRQFFLGDTEARQRRHVADHVQADRARIGRHAR
jgi:hypothetical protein